MKIKIFLPSNLKLLRKHSGLSQEELSKRFGLTRSSYSGYENEVAEPGMETLLKITEFYRIPLDDLIRKDMSQLSESDWEAIEKGVFVDTKGKKLRVLTSLVSEENEDFIEMIPQKASAGYTMGYADPNYISVLPTFRLPFLKKDRKYRSFPISGDSMPPVSHGSYVVAEYIQNWETFREGTPHIVVTNDDGIVFKIIHRIPNRSDVVQLSSTNPLYEPYLVNVNDILELWKFVNYISSDLPDIKIDEKNVVKSIRGIQQQVNELKVLMQSKY